MAYATYETPHLQHNKGINETSLMQHMKHHLCNTYETLYMQHMNVILET